MSKEKENLEALINKVNEKKLFLGVVKNDFSYPQLVVSRKFPTESGVKSFCFFVFNFSILKSDENNEKTPSGIRYLKVFPYTGKINGISDSLVKKINFLEENIEKLLKKE